MQLCEVLCSTFGISGTECVFGIFQHSTMTLHTIVCYWIKVAMNCHHNFHIACLVYYILVLKHVIPLQNSSNKLILKFTWYWKMLKTPQPVYLAVVIPSLLWVGADSYIHSQTAGVHGVAGRNVFLSIGVIALSPLWWGRDRGIVYRALQEDSALTALVTVLKLNHAVLILVSFFVAINILK